MRGQGSDKVLREGALGLLAEGHIVSLQVDEVFGGMEFGRRNRMYKYMVA